MSVTEPARGRTSRSRPSTGAAVFNFFARLLAWYSLYTVLFRCPSNPTPDDPALCQTAHTIKTTLQPHVQPYYDTYLAPYVEQYAPYVQQANKEYLTPAYNSASESYRKYAEPHVVKGQQVALEQYTRVVKPQLDVASQKAGDYYGVYLQPHVATANEKYTLVKPHIDNTKQRLEVFHKDTVLPAYEKSLPYVLKAYEQGKYVLLAVVAPVVRDGGEKAVVWGAGVWKDVIGPQVGRIGERLGGNGNGVPAASVSSSVFSSLSATDGAKAESATSSLSSIVSSASASAAAAKDDKKKKVSPAEARVIIESDLKTWTDKFQTEADKTVADLSSHIDDLSSAAMRKEVSHVEPDLAALSSLVDSGFKELKDTVLSLTKTLTPDSSAEEKEAALATLSATARKVGVSIRDKAQEIRKQSEAFLSKLYDAVADAADSHMTVLDSISDVGLAEIGMRWAWMDHVTYKDWAAYHDLKNSFQDKRDAVVKSAEENQKLNDVATWAQMEWQGRATDIAKEAAEELKRLKDVSKDKIELADQTEDFSAAVVPVAVKKAAQQVLKEAEDVVAAAGEKQEEAKEKVESIVDDAKTAVEEAATKVSEAVLGTEQPYAESVVSAASEAVEDAASKASEAVLGTEQPYTESVVSVATEAVEDAASKVSEAVLGTEQPLAESVVSVATEAVEDAASQISEKVYGTEQGAWESGTSVLKEKVAEATEKATEEL